MKRTRDNNINFIRNFVRRLDSRIYHFTSYYPYNGFPDTRFVISCYLFIYFIYLLYLLILSIMIDVIEGDS